MASLPLIKSQIMHLFKSNTEVHIDISTKSGRKQLADTPAVITGAHRNIFTARLKENDLEKNYTFQYTDLIAGTVEIKELNQPDNQPV